MAPREQVILCGPFPTPHQIGGYARANELTATSFLDEEFGIRRLPITVPGEGGFVARLATDLVRTRRCLRQTDAPIFHLTAQKGRGTYREWAQFRMAKRAGRRFVMDVRAGAFAEEFPREPRHRRAMLRRMLRGADAVTVEGRPFVAWIAREFGREALWLPNFVRLEHRGAYPRAPLDPPGPGEPWRLIFTGRVIPEKGLEELIGACRRLRALGLDVHLDVVGPAEPAYQATLRRIAERNASASVTFHGRLEHGAVMEALARSHVYAFPSRWVGEGHSNAVNEAMQVGLPVVTTDQGFLADVVTPACGALVPRGDEEALAEALGSLLRDPERLRRSGAAARERVYSEFSDAVVLERLARLYRQLLGRLPERADRDAP